MRDETNEAYAQRMREKRYGPPIDVTVPLDQPSFTGMRWDTAEPSVVSKTMAEIADQLREACRGTLFTDSVRTTQFTEVRHVDYLPIPIEV